MNPDKNQIPSDIVLFVLLFPFLVIGWMGWHIGYYMGTKPAK